MNMIDLPFNYTPPRPAAYSLLSVTAGLALAVITPTTALQAANPDLSGAERVKPARPVIPDRTFTPADFGAVSDGPAMNTDAFKKAIAVVGQTGGGSLVAPKGVFIPGALSKSPRRRISRTVRRW